MDNDNDEIDHIENYENRKENSLQFLRFTCAIKECYCLWKC